MELIREFLKAEPLQLVLLIAAVLGYMLLISLGVKPTNLLRGALKRRDDFVATAAGTSELMQAVIRLETEMNTALSAFRDLYRKDYVRYSETVDERLGDFEASLKEMATEFRRTVDKHEERLSAAIAKVGGDHTEALSQLRERVASLEAQVEK